LVEQHGLEQTVRSVDSAGCTSPNEARCVRLLDAVAFVDSDDRGAAAGIAVLLDDPLNTRGAFSDGVPRGLETAPFRGSRTFCDSARARRVDRLARVARGRRRRNDLLIAAQALALRCTVVTENQREFKRVSDLRVENWLRA
jgi:hypothetical protein